jgi:hypothetical protein
VAGLDEGRVPSTKAYEVAAILAHDPGVESVRFAGTYQNGFAAVVTEDFTSTFVTLAGVTGSFADIEARAVRDVGWVGLTGGSLHPRPIFAPGTTSARLEIGSLPGSLGTDFTTPTALGAAGLVAGESDFGPGGLSHLFTWTAAGGIVDRGAPTTPGGVVLSYSVRAEGITDAGAIVVTAHDLGGVNWGTFLYVPRLAVGSGAVVGYDVVTIATGSGPEAQAVTATALIGQERILFGNGDVRDFAGKVLGGVTVDVAELAGARVATGAGVVSGNWRGQLVGTIEDGVANRRAFVYTGGRGYSLGLITDVGGFGALVFTRGYWVDERGNVYVRGAIAGSGEEVIARLRPTVVD